MTRLYGRAPSSERVNDYVPDVRFERQSVIAAMGLKGYIATVAFEGTLNGKFFSAYVAQALAPTMNSGDTLVLDNLSSHKVKGALQPLYDKGVKVIFLPPYSPDFNPIELSWSKFKSVLRKLKARTKDALIPAIKTALESVTISDAAAWFRHSGYSL